MGCWSRAWDRRESERVCHEGWGVVFVCVCDSTLYGLIWPLLQMWLWPGGHRVVSVADRETTEECAQLMLGEDGVLRDILLRLSLPTSPATSSGSLRRNRLKDGMACPRPGDALQCCVS